MKASSSGEVPRQLHSTSRRPSPNYGTPYPTAQRAWASQLAGDRDRTARVVKHAETHRAQQHAGERATSTRTDDDHPGVLRRVGKDPGRMQRDRLPLDVDSRMLVDPARELLA